MKRLITLILSIIMLTISLCAEPKENEVYVSGSILNLKKYIKFCDENLKIRNLYVKKYEVTRKEFEEFMGYYYGGNKLKHFSKDGGLYTYYSMMPTSDCAAVLVTFYEACKFCNWQSEKNGLIPVYIFDGKLDFSVEYSEYKQVEGKWIYNIQKMPVIKCNENSNGYRLPTLNEYFYLLLGGKNGIENKWWEGISISDYENSELHSIKKVGTLKPNPLGLYDLLSNASEWLWGETLEYSREDNINYAKNAIGYTIPKESVKDFNLLRYFSGKKKLSSSRPLKRWFIGFRMVRNAE